MPSPCSFCGKPASPVHAPFCSTGCKDRDLVRWLGDGYRIPGPAVDPYAVDPDGLDSGPARD